MNDTGMNEDGKKVGEVRQVDAEGFLLIEPKRAGEFVQLDEVPDGTITVTPVVVIPRRELGRWLETGAEHT